MTCLCESYGPEQCPTCYDEWWQRKWTVTESPVTYEPPGEYAWKAPPASRSGSAAAMNMPPRFTSNDEDSSTVSD